MFVVTKSLRDLVNEKLRSSVTKSLRDMVNGKLRDMVNVEPEFVNYDRIDGATGRRGDRATDRRIDAATGAGDGGTCGARAVSPS
jgi:hypothetical protein